MSRREAERASAQAGFVLIAVLAVLALLAGMVIALSLYARNAVDSALLVGADFEAESMLQSGAALAGFQLFVLGRSSGEVDGQQIRLDQGIVTLTVVPEASRIDLNGAAAELLAAAYRASAATTMAPEVFAARVIDWRDADDETTTGGAESEDYGAAGLDFVPRNGALASIDDLRWVLGVTAADVAAITPFVTVHNPAGMLDAFSADPSIVAALPLIDEATLGEIVAARRDRGEAAVARLTELLAGQAGLVEFNRPKVHRVTIEARPIRGGRVRRSQAVMIAPVVAGEAYQVIDWVE